MNAREYFGCKAYGHDASLFSLNCEEQKIQALSLERFTRVKRDAGHVCLMKELWQDMDEVAFSFGSQNEYMAIREVIPLEMGLLESPVRSIVKHPHLTNEEKIAKSGDQKALVQAWLQIEGLLKEGLQYQRIPDSVWTAIQARRLPQVKKMKWFDHHTCHAASAYFHCGFPECAVVTLDGWGDNCFSKVFYARNGKIIEVAASECTWTWGWLYSKITRILGLFDNADEGKVEALAAYGEPCEGPYQDWMHGYVVDGLTIRAVPERLHSYWQPGTLEKLREQLGDKNLAATVQAFLQDKAVEYVTAVTNLFGPRLAVAGGIFANVKMNQAIFEKAGARELYIVPAMNDSGSAQGAAYLSAMEAGEDLGWLSDKVMPYWGPSYSNEDVLIALNDNRVKFKAMPDLTASIVSSLVGGSIVALFQGAGEFGPRALGNRSILAIGTGGEAVKDRINKAVKKREWYQPFCPAVLESERERLFVDSYPNKHMTCAFTLKDEHFKPLQAVAHIDKTARPQFVERSDNPLLFEILTGVKEKTGYGVLLNTSFNLHGRAMVLTPQHAIDDFIDCNLDVLYMGGYKVTKK